MGAGAVGRLAGHEGHGRVGRQRVTSKRPIPGSLLIAIVPPMLVTRVFTIVMPMPVPLDAPALGARTIEGLNRRLPSTPLMPRPLSTTLSVTRRRRCGLRRTRRRAGCTDRVGQRVHQHLQRAACGRPVRGRRWARAAGVRRAAPARRPAKNGAGERARSSGCGCRRRSPASMRGGRATVDQREQVFPGGGCGLVNRRAGSSSRTAAAA